MSKTTKILVVDDEPKIRRIVEQSLRKDAYRVVHACDGLEALQKLETEHPDLLVLDLMMPEMDGFEVCKAMRNRGDNTPVIILTAKDELEDKAFGFNLGVDDYVTKPFSPSELALRVKAVLRRVSGEELAPRLKEGTFDDGRLYINSKTREVRLNGEDVYLTAKEFDLLWVLANNPGVVYSRDQLLDMVWGNEYFGDAGTVTVLIRRIREKIEKDPANPTYLRTVWGIGYKFEAVSI
ncbi:response regulator transcription factor [Dethiobacter alkaliphilus]|uniref:Two component transcriptional regulator, winged helix family n=1 Tax=Dethiobacter alkaliphilus AHT 1 TaxID=555088 RepID=C0GCQ9_DETAL|nr:response regulator transcription factor [Dethiobacter alkaliphilus]EEG78994.1 two component transcriptional regulator, winged helix family [Dethiobacter alkaliphilus AHT 1]